MPAPDEFLRDLGDNPKEDKPRRPGRFKRAILIVLVVLLAVVIAALVYVGSSLAGISRRPFSLTGLSNSGGRTNVLVLGQGDPGHAGTGLTDTMMVVSFNRSTKQVAEISVPRDLRVDVPGYGYSKINEANALGGPTLARQVVSTTLGIPIDYTVSADFTSLEDLVNAVGGIDVNVTSELSDPEYPCSYNQYLACGLDIKPGLQHMDGATVLEYTRCRKGTCGNDFGRDARQQQVINLVRQKAISTSILIHPSRVHKLTSAIRNNFTTDLSGTDMLQLALLWQQQKGQPIQLVLSTDPDSYLTDAYGSSDLVPRDGTFAAIQAKVQGIFN
jgi:LCP family protein required for cell wall assembly